ncbi:MAG: gamma-glutamylcyclotransferase [Rhizobiaceae bacterium]|nr:gamma-glutamylcyclotransferase [Rhizobiaceae bacterium]
MSDFWVFGYGSLIWNPGFDWLEAHRAKIFGLHRSLCIYSWVHRGTPKTPGLVLGLDKGGSCLGMAFKVSSQNRQTVVSYLRERELVTNVYKEAWCRIKLQNGGVATALTYVVDRTSSQYCGQLSLRRQIEIVSSSKGKSGKNREYILNTVNHLRSIEIHDNNLENIAAHLRPD